MRDTANVDFAVVDFEFNDEEPTDGPANLSGWIVEFDRVSMVRFS